MEDWAHALEDELSEQYNIPANALGKYARHVEIELPATRHTLDVGHHNLYGFVISLNIADETGGVLVEKDLYFAVKQEDLADTVSNIYNSYG